MIIELATSSRSFPTPLPNTIGAGYAYSLYTIYIQCIFQAQCHPPCYPSCLFSAISAECHFFSMLNTVCLRKTILIVVTPIWKLQRLLETALYCSRLQVLPWVLYVCLTISQQKLPWGEEESEITRRLDVKLFFNISSNNKNIYCLMLKMKNLSDLYL